MPYNSFMPNTYNPYIRLFSASDLRHSQATPERQQARQFYLCTFDNSENLRYLRKLLYLLAAFWQRCSEPELRSIDIQNRHEQAVSDFRDRLEDAIDSAPDEHKRKKLERILNEM